MMMARRRPGEPRLREGHPLQAFPEVAPFATDACELTCRQGAHAYTAQRLAQRNGRILFQDPRTGQLGIARAEGEEGVDAMQFPFASVAVIMFLGSVEALEPE
jgi:hypothetical protein